MDIPAKMGIPDYEFRVVFGRTRVDFDQEKEEANRIKHGYSLQSAVWILERLILPTTKSKRHIVSQPFREKGEVRHMHMCVDDNGLVVIMVTTMRPDETLRVISFRKAHKNERETFQRLTGYEQPKR